MKSHGTPTPWHNKHYKKITIEDLCTINIKKNNLKTGLFKNLEFGNRLTSVGENVQFSPISFATFSPSLEGRSAITTLAPFRTNL